MRNRALWWFAMMAAVGAILLVPVTTQPARADGCPDYQVCPPQDPDWDQYIKLGVGLLASIRDKAQGGFDAVEIAQVMLELEDALLGVKIDLFEHVDALALADVRAGAKFAVDNSMMLDFPQTQGNYVSQVAAAAANSYERLTAFSSDAARDTVARVMITEYSALISGQIRIGYLLPSYGPYRQALLHIIENVTPHCDESIDPKLGSISYNCSFNGNTLTGTQRIGINGDWEYTYGAGLWFPGTLKREVIASLIMEGTAQDLAKRTLEELALGGH
jgi:hypothetical protein